ncbi:MAG: tripartite tricarboxylate transporter permease [Acetobacterales bacterium]
MIEGLLIGLGPVLSWAGIAAIVAGVAIGIIVGALPGLGPSLGIALLIPLTWDMQPAIGMLMLISLYMGAEYGGSISAILISTPGTAAATATVIDGYALNRQGHPGRALGASLSASTVGGLVGALFLIGLAAPLAQIALSFGPPEYFALGVFGLAIVSSLSAESPVKGWIVAVLGLAFVTVGVDPILGMDRFTFGRIELMEGMPFLTALIGLFAVAEVFNMVDQGERTQKVRTSIASIFLSLADLRRLAPTMIRGAVIGTVVGIIPGVGAGVGSWIAYDQEKRFAKHPETFGHGAIEGIAAPEAANNATVGGALIPMLALGIPGSATTAVLMGALIMHGLQPGPQIFDRAPDVVYGLFVGLLVSVVVMYVLGSLAMPIWVRMIAVPNAVLAPVVFGLAMIGSYALRNLMFDVWLALGFGVLGYVLKKFSFPLAPMILAMVLGYMIEANFRRSLLMSSGSMDIFATQPISAVFLLLAVLSFFWPLVRAWQRRRAVSPAG